MIELAGVKKGDVVFDVVQVTVGLSSPRQKKAPKPLALRSMATW